MTTLPSPDAPPAPGHPTLRRALPFAPAAALVLFLTAFPALQSKPYPLHMGVILFLAVLQGSAWNLIGGYGGQYSIGHAAYFGVGAYAAVLLLVRLGLAPWFGLGLAMVAAAGVAAVVGSITFRLRGPYFVLASIAAAEILRLGALYFRNFTNGAEGFVVAEVPALHLFGLSFEFAGKLPFYFLTLALAVAAVALSRAVLRSRLGYALLAIRDDQDAAQSLGIDVPRAKNVALALSAALTGAAGAVFAGFTRFVDPNTVFSLTDVSIEMALICILGGAGTVEGPVIGALLLVPLKEVLRNPRGLVTLGLFPPGSSLVGFVQHHLSNAHQLVYGLLLVVLVLFAPDGLSGLARRLVARRRSASPAAASP